MNDSSIRRNSIILIDAVRKGDSKAVKSLIKNIDSVDYNGNCALHHAVFSKDVAMVQLLLELGAKVDMVNNIRIRPYDLAFDSRDYQIIEILLKYKASVNVEHMAYCRQVPEKIANLLIEQVAIDELSFRTGYSALHCMVYCNNLNGVQKLLRRGADVNMPAKYDRSVPLHLVQSVRCVKLLLQKGAQPNYLNNYGSTPLCTIATTRGWHGISVSSRKEQGRMIETLFKNGADVTDVVKIALDDGTDWHSMEGLRDVLRYMAIMEDEQQYARKMNINLNDETNQFICFYRTCLIEVEKLRKELTFNTLTLYDWVIRNAEDLQCYLQNQTNVRLLHENIFQYRIRFPIYCDILQRQFDDAISRSKMQEKASLALSMAMTCVRLENIVTQKILGFLDEEDLDNLFLAYYC